MRKIILLIILSLITACTSVKEVSTVSTETEIIQGITIPVPEVKGQIELKQEYPIIKDNTLWDIKPTLIIDTGSVFTGEKEIQLDKDRKATIKIKVSKKKDKPTLIADVSVKQDSIKTETKLIKKSESKSKSSELKVENPITPIKDIIKWIVRGIFALIVLVVVLYLFKPSLLKR